MLKNFVKTDMVSNKKETYVEVPGYSQLESVFYSLGGVDPLGNCICHVAGAFLVWF